MPENVLRYTEEESADISSTGVLLTLDTKDRKNVAAVLHDADADADYIVESHYKDSDTDSEWQTLADNDTTSEFREEHVVPERWVRIRCDTAAGASDTAHVSISATK